ncbi:MAG TPA: tetratricopeptide repeat protein [Deferrisomatales bacterium]|nr:tetratricopeptide repeat protein [Deferrisomatales bacterium]
MAFGWFGKGKQGGTKALEKAHKLATQARWAEALSFYEEAAADPTFAAEAGGGARACREQLVTWNLEEAEAFGSAGETQRCQEHLELALQLASGEEDLAEQARAALARLEAIAPAVAEPAAEPRRMFEPSCGGAASCDRCDDPAAAEESPGEELFEFYLDSLPEAERLLLEHLDVGFQRGFVALQQGELQTAQPLLEEAAAKEPDLPGPVYALGLLAAVAGDAAAALESFRRALALDPDLAPAAHHQADLLCELERFGEAEVLLDTWLAGHPEDLEAHFLLARCRDRAGNPSGALEALTAAEKRTEAFDPRLSLTRASILSRQGDVEGALAAYQQTAARNPNLLEALVPLGQLLIGRGGGDAERAAELFKHCRRIDPERGWWHLLHVASAYAARGWADEARELLEDVRDELPDSDAAREQWQAVLDRVSGER